MDENTAASATGDSSAGDVLTLTAEVVSAYVSKNPIPKSALPEVIAQVHQSLRALSGPKVEPRPELVPAVPIKKSVMPEFIVCLEDGKKLKMLKRHLKTAYNMTPEKYRERWGLPSDYPMVAPNYAKQRSQLARELGLGTKTKRRRSA